MKASLIFLSGSTTLVLSSSNLTKTFNVNNISNNPKLTVNDNQTTLINNQYQNLSSDLNY